MNLMYFPPEKDLVTPEEWNAFLEEEAIECANSHSLDIQKVISIFHRLDSFGWDSAILRPNILDEAVKYIEPNKLLDMFENQPLEPLKTRYRAFEQIKYIIEYMNFSLTELADVFDLFRKYQQNIHDRLVHTGYIFSTFPYSFWLDGYLNRLYYVKSPFDYLILETKYVLDDFLSALNVDNTSPKELAKFDKYVTYYKDTYVCYKWSQIGRLVIKKNKLYVINPDGSKGLLTKMTTYSDAPYFDFLPNGMGEQLDSIRGKLFDSRIEVLRSLSNDIRLENQSSLLNTSINIIASKIMHDDAILIFQADKILTEFDGVPNDDFYREIGSGPLGNAGLLGLFHVIGHIENEMKFQSVKKITEKLAEIPFNLANVSYFRIPESIYKDKIESIIDTQIHLQKQRDSFFEEYNSSVSKALLNEFEINIPFKTKHLHHAYTLKSLLENPGSAQFQIEVINPLETSINLNQNNQMSEYEDFFIFKHMGDSWIVTYEGVTHHVKHTIGMQYIKYFLMHPNQEVFVDELEQLIPKYKDTIKPSKGDPIFADELRKRFKEKLDIINEKIALAESRHDEQLIDKLENEKKQVFKDGSEGINPDGSPKYFDAEFKTIRDRVRKNYNTARNSIEKVHPKLAKHLKDSITIHSFCRYKTPEPFPWNF